MMLIAEPFGALGIGRHGQVTNEPLAGLFPDYARLE